MNNNQIKPPILVFGARLFPSQEIPRFFEKQGNKLVKLLTNPPYLRYTGWNLLTLGHAEIKDAAYWEIKNGDRKTLRLYRDGTFIASCYADNTFLGWGREANEFDGFPLINSLAIVEYTYEFVELYRKFLECINFKEKITISFNLSSSKTISGSTLLLTKHEVKSIFYGFRSDCSPIIKEGVIKDSIEVNIQKNSFDSARIAFELLSKIYLLANIASDEIPYTKRLESGERVIDVNRIIGNK